jgi:hypothetical protein
VADVHGRTQQATEAHPDKGLMLCNAIALLAALARHFQGTALFVAIAETNALNLLPQKLMPIVGTGGWAGSTTGIMT